MSRPSFKLSKADGRWWASGNYASGRPFRFDVGASSVDKVKAEAVAETRIDRGLLMGQLANKRQDRLRAERAAKKAAAEAAPSTPPPTDDDETPVDVPRPAPPASDEPEPAPAPERTEEIAAKLRALGDGRPIEPDDVHGPDEDPRAEDPADPEIDEEAGELIAEIAAGAIVTKNVSMVSKILRAQKPPRRPGEGPEKMRQWYHDGMVFNLKKLFGKATAMGPTGKMFVGALLFNVAMFWNAEEVSGAGTSDGEAERDSTASSKPPSEAPAAEGSSPWSEPNVMSSTPAPAPQAVSLALVRSPAPNSTTSDALGKFK